MSTKRKRQKLSLQETVDKVMAESLSEDEGPTKKVKYDFMTETDSDNAIITEENSTVEESDEPVSTNVKPETEHKSIEESESVPIESYEDMVKRRIAENQAILAAAGLPEAIKSFMSAKNGQSKPKAVKKKATSSTLNKKRLPLRRSLRIEVLASLDPERKSKRIDKLVPVNYTGYLPPQEKESDSEDEGRAPSGPFMLTDVLSNESSCDIASLKSHLSQLETNCIERRDNLNTSLKSLVSTFREFSLDEDSVVKVTTKRVYSMDLHPDKNRLLVACGDTFGNLGLWPVTDNVEPEELHPHNTVLSHMKFNAWSPNNLITCSFDGTMRNLDLVSTQFIELIRTPDELYTRSAQLIEFDLHDENSIYACASDGGIYSRDQRSDNQCQYHEMDRLRTIGFNPIERNYFAVGGVSGNVKIFDIRTLSNSKDSPSVCTMTHNKTICACRFSPDGSKLLVTSYDDVVKLYNSDPILKLGAENEESMVKLPQIHAIPHNNQTGRWLSKFKGEWLPDRSDCFLIGSMKQPRCMELFSSETGGLLFRLQDHNWLSSVCSRVMMHTSYNAIVGGNSSGKVFIFKRPGFNSHYEK